MAFEQASFKELVGVETVEDVEDMEVSTETEGHTFWPRVKPLLVIGFVAAALFGVSQWPAKHNAQATTQHSMTDLMQKMQEDPQKLPQTQFPDETDDEPGMGADDRLLSRRRRRRKVVTYYCSGDDSYTARMKVGRGPSKCCQSWGYYDNQNEACTKSGDDSVKKIHDYCAPVYKGEAMCCHQKETVSC